MKPAVLVPLALVSCDLPRGNLNVLDPPNTASPLSLSPPAVERGALGETITVVSYNVNYGLAHCAGPRGCSADEETVRLIEELDADLVLLQETTRPWERVLKPRLAKKFAHVTFHDPTTSIPSGLGAFSKFPIEEDELLPSPIGWFPANRLVVRTSSGPLEVLNVHLRPMVSDSGSWVSGYFSTGHYRLSELQAFLPSLSPAIPTIVAGDFNEDTGSGALELLERLGFENALAKHEPSATTWRWTVSGLPLAMRLDHVKYEKKAFEVVSAEVLRGGKSDHLPVRVVLRRRGA